MKQVQILRIVVASPADVQGERDIIEEVATELNRGIAAEWSLRLEVTRWETKAYPGFHRGGPQGLIDLVLGIEESDILIGIFWKRFGTPTKDTKSGTEHEIREAYEAWKEKGRPEIMVYFNQKPYMPGSVEEIEQLKRVVQFKEDFPEEGLWWSYDGEREFERLVRNHLTQFILNRNPMIPSPKATVVSSGKSVAESVNRDESPTPVDPNSEKDPDERRPRRWVITASVLLALMVSIIVWQWPTTPVKVAYLELDLATGYNQRHFHDGKREISLMAVDVEQLDTLSGRAVFENESVADNYPCAWEGQRAPKDDTQAISMQTRDCSFTMRLQGGEKILRLWLTIAGETDLFTINIRPKQP